MSAPALSPITLEVVRNGLYAIAEEMSVIVMRSARSPLLKEAGDLSSALTDAQGRLIAQGRDIPIHMGVMGFTVKEFLKRIPADTLREGDVWFLNLPEVGGNHLPDVKAVRPVFFSRATARRLSSPASTGCTTSPKSRCARRCARCLMARGKARTFSTMTASRTGVSGSRCA